MTNAPTLYYLEKVEIGRIRPIQASLPKVQNNHWTGVANSSVNTFAIGHTLWHYKTESGGALERYPKTAKQKVKLRVLLSCFRETGVRLNKKVKK